MQVKARHKKYAGAKGIPKSADPLYQILREFRGSEKVAPVGLPRQNFLAGRGESMRTAQPVALTRCPFGAEVGADFCLPGICTTTVC